MEKILEVLEVSGSELFAFDHLKPQEELIAEIVNDLHSIKDREKIETIYKLIEATINE